MTSPIVLAHRTRLTQYQWLELRRTGIGGSDAAAVAGLSPWRSPYEVWLEKTGLLPIEMAAPSRAAKWGQALEGIVAQVMAQERGIRIRKRNVVLQHPKYPWVIGNIDRVAYTPDGPAVLEVKTTSRDLGRDDENWPIPVEWQMQIQHYLAITGYDRAFLAVLIAGQDDRWREILRDDDAICELMEIEAAFWDRVQRRDPPLPEGTHGELEFLKSRYPVAEPEKRVVLPLDAASLIEEYRSLSAEATAVEKRRDAVKARLQELLGDAEEGILPGTDAPVVTWRNVNQRRLDADALRRSEPELYARYLREMQMRRFEVR
jgi:putative phage-type endonuclease